MCSVPSSLPFFDSDTATSRPSGEGRYQSIAVLPLPSRRIGSSSTFSRAGSAPSITTSRACAFGGWRFSANSAPPAVWKLERDARPLPTMRCSSSRTAWRPGSASSTWRVRRFCAATQSVTSGAARSSSQR